MANQIRLYCAAEIAKLLSVYNNHVIVMGWHLSYYNPKVAETVESWPVGIRAHFLRLIEIMAEHGPDLGMPHTRAMGAGLFELRAKGREGIGRAFYCTLVGARIVILHAMVKKTEKTPQRALQLARTRLHEVKHEP